MLLTLAGDAGSPGLPGTPDLDLEVPDGARFGDLRPRLAAVSGRPELAARSTTLAIDETVADDEQLTGQVPLLTGAVLRRGPGAVDADRAALRAEWHVAVMSGPDCGALRGLDEPVRRRDHAAGTVAVGRGGDLAIDDLGISRRHLTLRLGRNGPVVQDVGSQNGTVLIRARRRRGVRLRRRAVLHPGDRLVIGATILEIRRDGLDPPDVRVPGREGRGRGRPAPSTLGLAAWFGPALGSLVLALSTGNRLLLGLALLGPAIGLWPALRARLADRRAPRTGDEPRAGRQAPAEAVLGPSPADLTKRALRLMSTGSWSDLAAPRAAGTGVAGTPATAFRSLALDGCLAIVGPRPLAVAAARALVVATLQVEPGSDAAAVPVVVRAGPDRADDWAWCRWLTATVGADDERGTGASPGQPLLVSDCSPGEGRYAELARRWAGGRGAAVLLIERDRTHLPPWCRSVLEVRAGSGVATLDLPGGRRTVPLRAVSSTWAETHARRIAGLRQLRGISAELTGDRPPLPARVAFAALPGVPSPDADAVAALWEPRRAGPAPGLIACLGVGGAGVPVLADLVRDGPHTLVAGTTGAGKSELLQTLLLSLALTHSPAELAIVLIDYKGGTSFGACADLPHVAGQVTDLDPALAARALSGLRGELHRREEVLATAGVSDLDALRARGAVAPEMPAPPPRLLVVIDEFRALTEDLPSFVPGLLRLAAQGRSLGIHLVLATQRPAGAVGPELRANLALRIALRVTDVADSLDVVDAPDAATIPTNLPGRAILRRGAAPPEPFQVARVGLAPDDPAGTVRIVAWAGDPGWQPPAASGTLTGAASVPDGGRAYVDAIAAAATALGLSRPEPPWLPPLPAFVPAGDLGGGAFAGLPLALADLPAERRRDVVGWDPSGGHLLVLGAPGSGRSTTLRTAAAGALSLGWHVHAVGIPDPLLADLRSHPCLGTVIGPGDPRVLARLVTLLGPHAHRHDGGEQVPQLLLIDGLDATLEALGRMARGAGADLLVDVLRAGRGHGVGVIATAGSSPPGPIAGHFPARLVLPVGDRTTETLCGVPSTLAGSRRGPGRAVLLPPVAAAPDGGGPVLCQVAVTEPAAAPPGDNAPVARRARRVVPLPALAAIGGVTRAHAASDDAVVVGLGGDDARPVMLDVSRGALVVGPPGSGRSTALAVIAGALLDRGRPMVAIARDGPLRELGTTRAAPCTVGFDAGAIARLLASARPGAVVLVDDLDALEQQHPATGDALAALVSTPAGPGRAVVVVGSAQTSRAATAYRGVLGALRGMRAGIVLAPAEPGSGEVFGVGLEWVTDPESPQAPGRGARQNGRDVVVVQVLDPGLP